MMEGFVYRGMAGHVLFGRGTLAKAEQVLAEIGGTRVMLLSTPGRSGQADRLADLLGDHVVARFPQAEMHTPVDVTERALPILIDKDVDTIIAIGGGSAIGLSKALALRTGLPQIVVPTTYAGSEMTPILGQTVNGRKTTQRSLEVLPEAVIYDVDLTLGLPPTASGTSGMNAIAHAVEGLYARDTNPIMQIFAEQGIRALAKSLPRITTDPGDIEARTSALYGAWLCGMVLGSVGMALHHKLCHAIGGRLDLPHADTHSAVLPHVVAYNAAATPAAMAILAHALSVHDDPAGALWDLARLVGAKPGLRDLGMTQDQIPGLVEEVLANAYWNPREPEPQAISDLVAATWLGDRPRFDR